MVGLLGASAVSHRAEAWRNKAHSRTHHRAVHTYKDAHYCI